MSSYLTRAQIDMILRPINPKRVYQRDGMAYVEAYEIKAHMARIFGVARWSSEVIEQHMICEEQVQTRAGKPAWYVAYRSIVRVTVCAPDGTQLAVYTEGHAGDSTHPTRGEAHGNAITNSESYAFKRCATMALLDAGGLSLYGRGSTDALVKVTLVYPDIETYDAGVPDVDEGVTQVLPETVTVEVPVSPAGGSVEPIPVPDQSPVVPLSEPPGATTSEDVAALTAAQVEKIRDRVHEAMQIRSRNDALMKLTRINLDAAQAGLQAQLTTMPSGEPVTVAVLVDSAIKLKSRAEASS